MSYMKKIWTIILVFGVFSMCSVMADQKKMDVVDLAGRTVSVPVGAQKVILGESRMIYAIAALYGKNGNPFVSLVGWKNDLENYDPDAYQRYAGKFPEVRELVNFGNPYQGDFNIEKAISLDTEVVVMNLQNLFRAQETGMISKLEKAGIATVFVDFRQRPTQNAIPSILLLGKIFDKQAEASALIDFYVQQMQKVYARVANKKDEERPLVLLENASGSGYGTCCSAYGSNNMGRFIEIAGGRNWGSQLFGGLRGQINPEMVFTTDPDIIIGTGANWSKDRPQTEAVLLGYDADSEDVQKRIHALANRKGWDTLTSVKSKRFHSIYHQFYNSPYHFIAIQVFAKWFYPKDFKDVDPLTNFKNFHEQFLPISYSGQFWATLQ